MIQRTKDVTLSGLNFEIGRFLPDVGSYLLGRLIGSAMKAGENAKAQEPAPETEPAKKPTGEEMVRTLATALLLVGEDFELHRFVQHSCMKVCRKIEATETSARVALPVVNDSGVFFAPAIRDDISLVMRLTVEALVFNFSDFFDQGGIVGLAPK
jgi:hypothetical protein